MAKAILAKQVSSEEVVRAHLDRIAHLNGKLNAVVQLASERAQAEARAADAALALGQIKGPLHGVPMTIKDSFDTEGIISTAGTKGRARFVPAYDATVVARLRAAGAILLGKTNTPEFTLDGVTDNRVYGRTNNPFDLSRTVGGSSGGAAAVVAAGASPFDIGTDTFASVRWPAHCCGVASIKPTSGRASLAGHIVDSRSLLGHQTQPGPLARYVEDLTLVLPVISGLDPLDPAVQEQPFGDPATVSLNTLRVAFHTYNGVVAAAAEIVQVVRNAGGALAGIVATVEERRPAQLVNAPAIDDDIVTATGPEFFLTLLQSSGTSLSDATQLVRDLTNLPKWTNSQKAAARSKRDSFKQSLLTFMQDYDVILCPVSPYIAPLHTAVPIVDPSYTFPYNLAGFPAAVIRAGTSNLGLPIGVQIVGRPWEEHVVLAVAAFLEKALGGWRPLPPPVLQLAGSPRSLRLSWKGPGTLQASDASSGPWNELPQAASPYRVTNDFSAQFYRVRQ